MDTKSVRLRVRAPKTATTGSISKHDASRRRIIAVRVTGWDLKNLQSRVSSCKSTPLGQSGGAIESEGFAVIKMTFLIEMIVDRGVGGSKFLQGLDVLSAFHVKG